MSSKGTLVLLGFVAAIGLTSAAAIGNDSKNAVEVNADEELLKWEAPSEVRKVFPYQLCGLDEEGSEIWFVEIGSWDIRNITEEGGDRLQNYRKYIQQMYTRMAYKHRDSENSKHAVVIIDMGELSYERAFHPKSLLEFLALYRQCVQFIRNGGFKKVYIVNVNAVFDAAARLGSSYSGDIASLAEFYGTQSNKWIPKLLKVLPKSQLPESLGGEPGFTYKAVYG